MLNGYPQPGKEKSRNLLEAFVVQGAGGRLVHNAQELEDGGAAFYGTVGLERHLREAQERARTMRGDWYYLDNAFLDAGRGSHFRVGQNALQGPLLPPDFDRLERLGVKVQPWTRAGRHVLVVEQSDYFMREVIRWAGASAGAWTEDVMRELAKHTDRPIRVRHSAPDKIKLSRTLAQDLEGCWALVTHSSAAAITALLAGVPVFCTGQTPALELGSRQLSGIEFPRRADGRHEWAARLAASQWTVEELAHGAAWRALNLGAELEQ